MRRMLLCLGLLTLVHQGKALEMALDCLNYICIFICSIATSAFELSSVGTGGPCAQNAVDSAQRMQPLHLGLLACIKSRMSTHRSEHGLGIIVYGPIGLRESIFC